MMRFNSLTMTDRIELDKITTSAPGRICLFGEHQDYFGLPVIPAAIDLRISITGERRSDRIFVIEMPDINSRDEFPLDDEIPYVAERDYIRSAVNVLKRRGVNIKYSYNCTVHGDIPINSGTASSSALCVAWVKFLLEISGHPDKDNPEQIAYLAYLAEVEEFNEPGGMMDHNASAIGNIVYVEFKPEFQVTRLPSKFGTFVLGDSLQEKDTKKTLARIKKGVLDAIQKMQTISPDFTLAGASPDEMRPSMMSLPDDERLLLEGTMMSRDIVHTAKELLISGTMDDRTFGEMLNAQQKVIRHNLRTSTPKLDAIIDAAIGAGALGGKVNGSGEGGCMFAYAPSNPDKVAKAIENAGGKPYIIKIGDGLRFY